MSREPRTRLPLAGLLIIFVAPLASLMVIVPSLFAGGVQKIQSAVPAIISRLVPNPSPHEQLQRTHANGLPPVALAPKKAAPPISLALPLSPAAPVSAPTPAPAPTVVTTPPTVVTPPATQHTNHGRRRRRRPHQDLDD